MRIEKFLVTRNFQSMRIEKKLITKKFQSMQIEKNRDVSGSSANIFNGGGYDRNSFFFDLPLDISRLYFFNQHHSFNGKA